MERAGQVPTPHAPASQKGTAVMSPAGSSTCSSAHPGSFPSVKLPSSVLMASRMLCAKPGLREAGSRARTCRKAARTSGQRWAGVSSQPRASSCRATGRSASAGSLRGDEHASTQDHTKKVLGPQGGCRTTHPSDPGAGASSACICSRCPCRALCERTPPCAGSCWASRRRSAGRRGGGTTGTSALAAMARTA